MLSPAGSTESTSNETLAAEMGREKKVQKSKNNPEVKSSRNENFVWRIGVSFMSDGFGFSVT